MTYTNYLIFNNLRILNKHKLNYMATCTTFG
jgi:hypothetical protein